MGFRTALFGRRFFARSAESAEQTAQLYDQSVQRSRQIVAHVSERSRQIVQNGVEIQSEEVLEHFAVEHYVRHAAERQIDLQVFRRKVDVAARGSVDPGQTADNIET